jgi:hypothetical protein
MKSFREAPETSVYVCAHVWREREPVTRAGHAPSGEWVFMCARPHDRKQIVAARAGALLERDDTLDALAGMARGSRASRTEPSRPWVIEVERSTRADAVVEEHIDRVGWSVATIPADDEGPAFAYTIGLYRSYQHPELIMFGTRHDLAGAMVNACAMVVKSGRTLSEDLRLDEIMRDHPVGFRTFARARYAEHLGRAIDLYGGEDFPALQVCWPDRHGRFPWEPGCVREVRDVQPLE